MTQKFISVIIPTFNRSTLVLRAIESVLKQTYKNFELIVVDDGSTDDTKILLEPFIATGSIQYFQIANSGVAAARNFGAKKAIGSWFAFLDSDDEWLPNKLKDQINFLKDHKHLEIVFSDEIWMRNKVRVNQKKIHQKFGGHIFTKCLEQCLIAPSSVLLSRNLFEKMNGFDENYIVCEDYDLWLRISSQYEIGFIDRPLIIKYGGHNDQLSTKYFAMDMWRLTSMNNILQTMQLPAELTDTLLQMMKQKGNILLQGYIKHNNSEAAFKVKKILDKIEK